MATVNITCENDADFRRTFLYQSAEGSPIVINGKSMLMMLRKNAKDVTALLELSTENHAITILPSTGTFQVVITKAQLEQLPVGTYEQSMILIDDGTYTKIWRGKLTNEAGPSR